MGVPNSPGSAIHRRQNPKAERRVVRRQGISVRLVPGRQKTTVSEKVSKVLHILPGIYKQNVGQRWVGKGT